MRNDQLVVGTDIGTFISADASGAHWAVLGSGLPTVPVSHLQIKPGAPNTLVAATYGRGVYTYSFVDTSAQLSGTNPNPPAFGATLVSRGSACAAGTRLTFRINPPRRLGRVHGRVVRVVVFANGRRLLTRRVRRGGSITRVSFRRPSRSNLVIRIVSYNNRGGHVTTTRRFRGCTRTKVRGKVKRHRSKHGKGKKKK